MLTLLQCSVFFSAQGWWRLNVWSRRAAPLIAFRNLLSNIDGYWWRELKGPCGKLDRESEREKQRDRDGRTGGGCCHRSCHWHQPLVQKHSQSLLTEPYWRREWFSEVTKMWRLLSLWRSEVKFAYNVLLESNRAHFVFSNRELNY